MLYNWSIQAISECCWGGKKECWKLFIDVVRPEYDEMLSEPSKSRRVWKSFVFSSCFLFQHVTHALSGFSRLSHENVEHFDRRREEKVSQAGLSTLFLILTFIVIHSSSDVKKRTSIKLFCTFLPVSLFALSELYVKIFDYIFHCLPSVSTSTASRFGEKLTSWQCHSMRCGHETEREKKSGYHHIFRMM